MYKLFIDSLNNRIGVYQNGELVEIYDDFDNIEGNIYSARVKNIVDGIKVVFCNIGIQKDGMLQSKDIVGFSKSDRISEIIDKKKYRLVQVIKNPVEDKGPKLTEHIKLGGRNIILMLDEGIYFSDKLTIDEKSKLAKLLVNLNLKYGVIIRSSAVNIAFDELVLEIRKLADQFDEIIERYNNSSEVSCLYNVGGIVDKLITDLYSKDFKIEVNSKEEFELIKTKYPESDVEFVDKILKNKMKSKISLKSGGYLIIEETFAGTMIDVNSGNNIISNKDGVFLDTNIEAAIEIARQMRLRDMSGIIIVDFINLNNDDERNKVIRYLSECVKYDRAKVNVVDFTKLRIAWNY